MTNASERPLGGLGMRSERGAWAATVGALLLMGVAVVMSIIDVDARTVWLLAVATGAVYVAFGAYCIVWFRRR